MGKKVEIRSPRHIRVNPEAAIEKNGEAAHTSVQDGCHVHNRRHSTVKGCEKHEIILSRWRKFVRLAVSTVLPAGKYQKRIVDPEKAERGPQTVLVAGGKRVSVESGAEYAIDNYIEHYDCKPPTLFIPIITLVQVCVFIAFAVVYGGVTANTGAPRDSPLIYNPARRYEAWRYLTYMFLHEGYIHIIFNVLVQLVLGIPLEMVHKWWRVAIVYMLGVIAGSCAHSVTDRWTLLAGASGGVYALIGAHLAVIVMNWKEMNHEWMGSVARVLSSGPARLIFWIITPAIDLIIALYQRYGLEEDSKVGYAAHLGGALVGFLLGVPVMRNLHHRFWEEVLFYICLVIYILCMLFAIVWNIIYQDYPTTDWRNCCPDPIITKGDIDN